MIVRSVVGKVTTFGEEMKTFGRKISGDNPSGTTKWKRGRYSQRYRAQQNIYWEVDRKG